MLELLLRGRIWIKLKARRFSPTAYSQSLHFETVLGHCYEQSGSSDYQIAVKYGRKMEYLDDSGELTTSGAALAHFYLAEAMVMEMAA